MARGDATSGGRLRHHAVGVAQLVELLVVVQAVGGSSPLAHPPRPRAFGGSPGALRRSGASAGRRSMAKSITAPISAPLIAAGIVPEFPSASVHATAATMTAETPTATMGRRRRSSAGVTGWGAPGRLPRPRPPPPARGAGGV